MPLQYPKTANALLRLFKIELSWEQLEKLDNESLLDGSTKAVVCWIRDFDSHLDCEIFLKEIGTQFLLELACNKEIHLQVVMNDLPYSSEINIFRKNQLLRGKVLIIDLFKELRQIVLGNIRPPYTMENIGELILSQIYAKRKASLENSRYQLESKVYTNFRLYKDWHLDFKNPGKLNLLLRLLNESLSDCNYPDTKFTFSYSSIESVRGDENKRIEGVLYIIKEIENTIFVNLETTSIALLKAIDLKQILAVLKQKISEIPPLNTALIDRSEGERCRTVFFKRTTNGAAEAGGLPNILTEEELTELENKCGK